MMPFMPLRWGFVFLYCPIKLTDDQRLGLVRLAVHAYMEDLQKVDFEWDYCHGEVQVTSEAMALGAFYGQRFTADVFVPEGNATVEFLVTEAQLRAVQQQAMAEA